GGWKLHSETTGIADVIVESDEEAMDVIRKFLSYFPGHHNEAPPRAEVPEGSNDLAESILDIIPDSRHKVYDVRKVIEAVVDKDSFFEIKERFGRSLVTGLSRVDGRTVGIIANNPIFKGGAIDADAADKAVSFIVMCDSFNIP